MKIKQATLDDCRLINEMAWQVFPQTYKNIITKAQISFMMDWMYSPESLYRQITREHHTYLLAYDGTTCKGYVSVQQQAPALWHLQKIYVLPCYQGERIGRCRFAPRAQS